MVGSMRETEIRQIKDLTDKVHGWLTAREGELLYELARSCTGQGVIVEIGSWKGKSTIWLAKGSMRGNKVKTYAIDPHSGASEQRAAYGEVRTFTEFQENIKNAKVDALVEPLVKTSAEAAQTFTEPVELIFIDGAHEYEVAKLDFELWFPRVIEKGIMAFHDTQKPGPKRVVKEFVCKSSYFCKVDFVDSIIFAHKTSKNSLVGRMKNRSVFMRRKLYKRIGKLAVPVMRRVSADGP